ncbi:hypothetical protein ONE63_002651 [Megalurothrips usitatus]|uniref:PDZ domain-containing protein n=1 Tax=Megalurothrips usitatus TaxID=439358 RepID=A0AAV7XEZ4_9NEOP|nr:hypothetical protein ONE63_002651 [Megalurothrips usitatus]
MAPALRSLPLQQQPPPATGSDGDEDQSTATTAAATPATGRCRHHHHHHHHCRQQTTPVDGDEDDASASMGSSGSRQPPPGKPGLLGRRTQSSGSLCTADRLGRLLAPCGRHRHNHRSHYHNHDGRRANDGHADHHRHLRYKLCGSLPNHLDASQQDGLDVCDNNNITPASPAASEKDLLDLGYASERSPDEEKHFPGDMSGACESVPLQRGSRGLGLSVCGGADCSADGLVRIKRLFPHQPAWQSGRLRPGDVLLAVNGEPLSGLTNHEALEVLRTASDRVVLTVARPSRPPSWLVGNGTASAAGRQLQPPQFLQLQPPGMVRQDSCGELEVSLSKVQGSLGFTLRKEDSSALGHYVRALVREPALSDGRIRPGDKIVAVNGVDICHLTHEEAVLFLRQAGDTVKLRLYRDVAQTPVSALSPTEAHKAFRPKTLRKEALDMLSDLAVRRMGPRGGAGGPGGPGCPGAGESATLGRPRKVSDGRPQTLAEQQRARTQSFELISSSHGGGGGLSLDREQSPLVDLVDSTVSSSSLSSLTSSCANSVVERPIHGAGTGTATATARRPDFLELAAEQQRERERAAAGKGGLGAPTWHLQRLTLAGEPAPDGWVRGESMLRDGGLDLRLPLTGASVPLPQANDGRSTDFASLPCDAASPDEDEADGGRQANFKYRSPAYQSAHPPCRGRGGSGGALAGASAPTEAGGGGCEVLLQVKTDSEAEAARLFPLPVSDPANCRQDSSQALGGEGRTGLLKWKGVVFTPEDDTDSVSSSPLDDTASQSTMEDNNGQVRRGSSGPAAQGKSTTHFRGHDQLVVLWS